MSSTWLRVLGGLALVIVGLGFDLVGAILVMGSLEMAFQGVVLLIVGTIMFALGLLFLFPWLGK